MTAAKPGQYRLAALPLLAFSMVAVSVANPAAARDDDDRYQRVETCVNGK